MIRFGICDDDREYAHKFKEKLINEFSRQASLSEEIKCIYYENSKEAVKRFNEDNIDIYFLDIEYGEDYGMDVARQLVKLREDIGVVYMTNYEYYAAKAFVCRPLGFIRKKHVDEDIIMAVASVNEYLEKYTKEFTFMNNTKQIAIKTSIIQYIKSNNHNLDIVLQNDTIQVRDKMSRIESGLTEMGFVKIDRSCIVNMKYIQDIKDIEIVLHSGEKLYASRDSRQKIFAKWQFYKMKY